ncbi:MAG TPA: (5-formylfuran-3-yl)methyl phosphate synthase [Gemmatimonadales bacterium]|nr:(5-formylfuran-3-yl)methyl phosphate synthase [Gemmatimonadales bacterium]
MQLLVSVARAAEVEAAVEGGADVIDAKDPSRGALGPVARRALAEIAARVPARMPFSVALGEVASPAEAARTIGKCPVAVRPAETYVKLASPDPARGADVRARFAAAARAARAHPARPLVVAVIYVDAAAPADSPGSLTEAIAAAGASGLLLDTMKKDGRSLLDWAAPARLREWRDHARAAGLVFAVAGSLRLEHLPEIAALGPDLVGVRGAACEGGRGGTVSARRVRELRAAVPPGWFANVQSQPVASLPSRAVSDKPVGA